MIDRTTLPGQWGVPFLAGLKTFAPSGSEMRGLGGGWWTGRDLNPGPRVCKTRDLPLIYRPIWLGSGCSAREAVKKCYALPR